MHDDDDAAIDAPLADLLREASEPAPATGDAARAAAAAWRAGRSPRSQWMPRAAAWLAAAAAGFTVAAAPALRPSVVVRREIRPAVEAPVAGEVPIAPAGSMVFSLSFVVGDRDVGPTVLSVSAPSEAAAAERLRGEALVLSRVLERPEPREILHVRAGRATRVRLAATGFVVEREGRVQEFPTREALDAALPDVAAEFGARLDP
jgi:hypothetical protein